MSDKFCSNEIYSAFDNGDIQLGFLDKTKGVMTFESEYHNSDNKCWTRRRGRYLQVLILISNTIEVDI